MTDPAAAAAAAVQDGYRELALKDPEGVTVDAQAKAAFATLLKDQKVSPEAAQAIYEHGLKYGLGLGQAFQAQAKAAFDATQQRWRQTVESDPDVGGARLQASQALVDRAVAAFGGKDLASAIESLGLKHHPLLFKAFAKVGATISEDTIAGSVTPAGGPAASAAPSTPAGQARALGYGKMAEDLERRSGGARR